MNERILAAAGVLLAAAIAWPDPVTAEEHVSEAQRHAAQAAESSGDSKAIGEHASAALQHVEKAKVQHADDPHMSQHLQQSERDLRSAVTNASRYNTDTAGHDAADAASHLEAAGK
ncbi:MAG: small metal-binding protein SmbP [Methylotetracoccus sp.]